MNEDAIHPENPVQKYPKLLIEIILRPTQFFKTIPIQGNLGFAIAFGLIIHWISHACEYLLGKNISEMFIYAFPTTHPRFFQWFIGTGSVVIDPIPTFIVLIFSSFVLWISASIWFKKSDTVVSRSPLSFESILQVSSYALAASIFRIIPGIGALIAYFMGFVYLVIGLREVLGISSSRSIWIAIFPKALLLFLFLMIFLTMGAMVWRFLSLAV